MSDNTLTRENQFYAEIAALRSELANVTKGFKAKVAELEQRTAERDAARRMYCVEMSRQSSEPKKFTPEWGARLFGWDCFAPHANATDVPVQNGGE